MKETDSHYRKALDDAKAELLALVSQRDEIENRIGHLRRTVRALAETCGEKADDLELWMEQHASGRPKGITDAIRQVLMNSDSPLTTTQLREELLRRGIELGRYQNALASMHVILTRLAKQGEAVSEVKDGKRYFRKAVLSEWWDKGRKGAGRRTRRTR